ncbi:MAG: DUF362 domain-containing protein [Candidatus Brocadiia bacterium]
MDECSRPHVTRRQFIRQGAGAAAALAAAPRLAAAAPAGPAVVVVRDKTQSVVEGFEVDADITQRLVDRAVMALAGKDDVATAWATFVRPSDRVAIKFNGLFRRATTKPEVIHAVVRGLLQAGVEPQRITVYDRSDKDMKTTGLELRREGEGVRIHGTGRDYGPPVQAGPVGTRLSNILLGADAVINIPMMKSHVRCSTTGALKNHLGSVPNAGAFHKDFCSAIADLNTLGPIKDKTRLCIADALYALYHAGPGFNGRFRWDFCGVLAATDPVALDATLDDIIRAKRLEKGLDRPHHNDPKHIARAGELGLGEADLAKVQRRELAV